jgi:6-phosphogluconolactonase
MYELLATPRYAGSIDWSRIHFFWGDERCVPPDHPGSNYRVAREALLDHLSLPTCNIHRIQGELEPESAARGFAADLRAFFGSSWPSFDLILLGLGNDGHTASLFPTSVALKEKERPALAVVARYEDRPAHRVTLTLPAINAARQVLFLVSGAAKAEIVAAVLQGRPDRYPAQGVRPVSGQVEWMLDAPAARLLAGRE